VPRGLSRRLGASCVTHTLAHQLDEQRTILQNPFWNYRVLHLDMPFRKVSQGLDIVFLEHALKGYRRKPKSDAEVPARDEYVAVDVATDSPKYAFER